jgi:acetylglutamate kinase
MIVIKLGGSTLGSHDTSLDDIAALHAGGEGIVVVHGGGALITQWLATHNIQSQFVRGLRATDERALDVVVAVLAGVVNKRIVSELQARGARAIGISGADAGVMRARRYDSNLGLVGQIEAVDASPLVSITASGAIGVLAPIGIEITDGVGQLLNINADTTAGAVAAALRAERLVFLTDVPGVMDGDGALISSLSAARAETLLNDGVVAGGMEPKIRAGLAAVAAGVQTVITDGRETGALRRALDGDSGTRLA